jgi:outer membrane receptor protein involved in Fe transport
MVARQKTYDAGPRGNAVARSASGSVTLLGCLFLVLLVAAAQVAHAQQRGDEAASSPAAAAHKEPPADVGSGLDSLLDTPVSKDKTSTARRSLQYVMESDRSGSSVSRRDMREMQATSVPDALAESTGILIQKTNPGAACPIIRGFVGAQNLTLIDGLRFNMSIYRTGPLQYLNITDPFAFELIEVVRGPGSALYGSDSFGGTIQLFTENIDFDTPWSVTGSLGTFSADQSIIANAQAHAVSGPFAALLGVSLKSFGPIRTGDDALVPESDYKTLATRAKLQYNITDSMSLTATYLGTMVYGAGRTDKLYNGEYRRTDDRDHFAYLRFRYAGSSFLREVSAALSFHGLYENVNRYLCSTANKLVVDSSACVLADNYPLGTIAALKDYYSLDDSAAVLGGSVAATFSFLRGDITATTGVEVYREWVDATTMRAKQADAFHYSPSAADYPDSTTSLQLGVYAHTTYTPLHFADTWRLSINGGARLTYANAVAPAVEGFGDVQSSFWGVVGTGGIVLASPSFLNIYFNFAQGFRAPNLQESVMVGDTGSYFEIANPELGPERIMSFETGAKLKWDMGRKVPVSLNVAFFGALLDDMIGRTDATYNGQAQINGKPVAKRVNKGGGRYLGLEAEVTASYKRFKLYGNGTWTKGELEGTDGTMSSATRVPPFFYNAGLRYSAARERWYAAAYVQGSAEKTALSAEDKKDYRICGDRSNPGTLLEPCERLSPWVTLNLRGGYRIVDALWFDLAFTNLTDRRYKTLGSGSDFPGFGVAATLTGSY